MGRASNNKTPTNEVPPKGTPEVTPEVSGDYILRGADLFFKLPGDAKFHLHSHFFTRESKFWRKELTGNEAPGDHPLTKGDSVGKPYVLNDIGPAELRLFVGIFYNPKFGDYSHVTLEDWMIILKYAHKWSFPKIKDLAIRYLENDHAMDTPRRITLYQENHLPQKYLIKYFRELVSREDFPTINECRILGVDNTWNLAKMREQTRVLPSNEAKGLSPLRKGVTEKDVDDLIVSTLQISLTDSDSGSLITKDQSGRSASRGADKTESTDQEWEDIDDFDDF